MIKYTSLFTLLVLCSVYGLAQNNEVIKYYNESWGEVSEDSAYYITTFKPENGVYLVTSRLKKSNALYRTSYYKDTDFTKPAEGASILYYENGQISDSMYMLNDGVVSSVYSYYPDGKQRVVYSFDPSTGKSETKGYDENGKLVKGYIYEREAEYPGGIKEWHKFIQNSKLDFARNTPPGEYRFQIKFILDETGKVVDIAPVSDPGYGMGKSAVKALGKSAKWIPAIQYNKPVKAYRVQPFVIVVPEGKKR